MKADAGPPRHFAVIAPPTLGHISPLNALARALEALGHRCTLVHVAGTERFVAEPMGFAALDGADGLAAYLGVLAATAERGGLRRMIRATAAMSARLLDGAPAVIARIGADAVLADSAEPAGALLARHLGLSCVATVTGLPLFGEPGVPPPFTGWRYRQGAVSRFNNRAGYAVARLLMRPIGEVIATRARAWALPIPGNAVPHVAQCPAVFDFPRSAMPRPFQYTAPWRTPQSTAVDLPDDGRPLVFCSLGSLQGGRARLFAAVTAACARVGARALVAHAGGLSEAEAAALPGDPIISAWWPQRAVLTRCRAAVLHGGFNTVLDALAAGVPIVAVPIAFEQPATAARLAWTGAGRIVALRRATERTLSDALADVLHAPGYRAAAGRLGATMAGRDGAGEAAAAISGWLASGAAATRACPG